MANKEMDYRKCFDNCEKNYNNLIKNIGGNSIYIKGIGIVNKEVYMFSKHPNAKAQRDYVEKERERLHNLMKFYLTKIPIDMNKIRNLT